VLVKRTTLSVHVKARKEGLIIRESKGAPPLLDEAGKENVVNDIRARPANSPTIHEIGGIAASYTKDNAVPCSRTVRRYKKKFGTKLKSKRARAIEMNHLHSIGHATIAVNEKVSNLA
jgi:transposase